MRKKKVTISDIAAKTGYSKTTVSFAFNWPNRISAEAVEKIMECAQELGYKGGPDLATDPSGKFKNLCLLIPETLSSPASPIWAKASLEIYRLCVERNFMLSVVSEKRISDSFFAKTCAVDAFILFCPTRLEDGFMAIIRKRKIPIIGINLNTHGATEEEASDKRIHNARTCTNLMFSLINDEEADIKAYEGAYGFISLNN